MKRILALSLACVSFSAMAQITAPTASFTVPTAYTSGAPNDDIFIFCTPDNTSGSPVSGFLEGNAPSGTAPFTFTWQIYNTATNSFDPFTITSGTTSGIGPLASGGYSLVVTDALGATVLCDMAWVFVNQTNVDAGSFTPACGGTITANGSVNAVANFVYYNPPPQEFLVSPTTQINICFSANHTYVSDLGFYLVGPPSCGSPTVLLSPNPGAVGLGSICNSGNNVNNLCFSNSTAAIFNVCSASTPLTGTFGGYATGTGSTMIDWTTIYGCDAASGGWAVQIYDCIGADVGALTSATISFNDPSASTSCGALNSITYSSGSISSTINDNSCTPGSASIFQVPLPPSFTTPITLSNSITSFEWTTSTGDPVPGATSSLTPAMPTPAVNTWFYLEATDNFGCTMIDSALFTNDCDCNLSVTATPSACDPLTNLYSLSGNLTFTDPPATGTLTVTNSCGGSQTFNAPFTSPIAYTIPGLNSDGASCTVTAVFSDSLTCSGTVNYTAPADCTPDCDITSVTATVSGCSPLTNTYTVSGNIVFANDPGTGALTVTSSCGSSQTFNAPFTSPQAYSFTGLPATGGTCTITATFSDDVSCTNSVSYTVPSPPVITTPLADAVFCNDEGAFTFSATPPGGVWNGASTLAGVFTPLSVTPGSYPLIYVSGGSCALSDTITAVVNALPVVNASATDATICVGQTTTLSVTGTASTFSWTPSGTLSSGTSANPTASPVATTTYTVTGTSAAGCVSTDNVTITVNPLPNITIAPIGSICLGDSVQLFAGGGLTYNWIPSTGLSANNISNPIAFPLGTTTYTVGGTDANGCTNTASVVVTVVNPGASFTATPSGGQAPLTVSFDNNSNGVSYIWDFGNGLGATTNNVSPDASTVYDSAGTYVITLVAIDGSCVDSIQFTIIVNPVSSLIIPNIITANGDGHNDDFKVIGYALETLQVEIFNRWGQKVGEIGTPDGKWSGSDYAEGTYYYILHAEGFDGVTYEKTGNFALVK